jgi:hypothetical protein
MKVIFMSFTFIVAASAGAISYIKRSDDSTPLYGYSSGNEDYGVYAADYKDYYAYPKYKFEYGVSDPVTGDNKNQWEIRDGDFVQGEYSLDEPDGTKRIVSYHADDATGFHAIVKKIGVANHYQPIKNLYNDAYNMYGNYGYGGLVSAY